MIPSGLSASPDTRHTIVASKDPAKGSVAGLPAGTTATERL